MSRNLKISGALVAAVLLVIVTALVWSASRSENSDAAARSATGGEVVRDESQVLGEPGSGAVTLVEFLDFECPACGALYPFVERLRADYRGRVTFVARHFPLPNHRNAMNAALAAEAAAQQEKFEQMYTKLYDTQSTWGGQEADHRATFRGFAQELGLDLRQYDRDLADPATRERISVDVGDGTGLGVAGTPAFFLNGKELRPDSVEEFRAAIEEALSDAA